MLPIYTIWSDLRHERRRDVVMSWKDMLFKPPAPGSTQSAGPTPDGTSLTARLRTLAQQPSTLSPVAVTPVAAVAIDPEFTNELVAAIGKGTKPGYDQFLDQCDSLQGVIADESVRLRTALATTAKFLKVPPEQIVASIQERADLLKAAKDTFDRDIQTEVDQHNTTCSNHLADVEKKLHENEAERVRLTTDKNDTQRQITELRIQTDAVRARFTGAYRALDEQLTAMLQRLR